MQNKFLSALGLARRAGKAVCGTDAVKDSVRKKRALLIVLACDVSQNTKKQINDTASYYGTQLLEVPYTMSELSDALGKLYSVACVAITDIGLKTLVINSLKHQEV